MKAHTYTQLLSAVMKYCGEARWECSKKKTAADACGGRFNRAGI